MEARQSESSDGHTKHAGACDVCRLRKIRCKRTATRPRCDPCETQDLICTVTYRRKRPGPPGRYADLYTSNTSTSTAAGQDEELGNPLFTYGMEADLDRVEGRSLAAIQNGEAVLPTPNPPMVNAIQAGFTPSWNDLGWDLPAAQAQSAKPSPFDAIISRALLDTVMDMYFDYVYCLVPFPDPSTFLRDYHGRRDEGPNEEEWIAMVLAMASFTISLVPHQILPGDKSSLRDIAMRCVDYARLHLSKRSAGTSLHRFFIVYCVGWVCHNLGETAASKEYHGMNVASALNAQLDRESSYQQSLTYNSSSEPTEVELLRRMWWLVYTGDRSAALSEGGRMLIGDEDLIDAFEPLLKNHPSDPGVDQPITLEAVPSVLDGFGYITKIWRLAGKILMKRDSDFRNPPSGSALRLREAEVSHLLDQLDRVLDGCPRHLRMDSFVQPSPRDVFDFPETLNMPEYDEGRLLIREEPERAFIIQQANIHITRQCLMFMGIQYQEYLFKLPLSALAPANSRFYEAKQKVLSDLLHILRTLPLHLIAVNALPGVSKIRYVASSLLEELEPQHHSQDISRAHDFLLQYINFLTQIEASYSLAD